MAWAGGGGWKTIYFNNRVDRWWGVKGLTTYVNLMLAFKIRTVPGLVKVYGIGGSTLDRGWACILTNIYFIS